MGLSHDAQRLAQINYGEAVTRLNKEYQKQQQAVIAKTPDGIGQQTALRQVYVEMLQKKSDAFIEAWLGSFAASGLAPDDDELSELHSMVEGTFAGRPPGVELSSLPTLTVQRIEALKGEMHLKLEKKVFEMRVRNHAREVTVPTYATNIEHNYGGLQQGPHNTQEINISGETKSRS